jgi:tetratricopeptide (TPR) repeat protein
LVGQLWGKEIIIMGNNNKINLFFIVVFFLFCVLAATQKIVDVDFWWHLKTGEWIWHHKAIPHVDIFSYTFQGKEWIDFEWFFQAMIYPIYQLGGFSGLILCKIVIVVATFVIIFLTFCEVDKGKRVLSITFLFVTLLILGSRFMERPQIVYLFFLALYVYLLILHRGERITTFKLALILLPIHILWVNLHGSFLLGIFLVGAYALGRFVPLALSHHHELKPVFHDKTLRGLMFLCVLLVLASFLNPYTYKIFLVLIKIATAREVLGTVTEWFTVDIRSLGLFAIEPTMWYRALFIIGVLSFLIRLDNLKKVENIVIFVLFSYLAFKYFRFSNDFAIATTPIIISNLTQCQWRVRKWKWVYFLPLIVLVVFTANNIRGLINEKRLGLGLWSNYPEKTVSFLREHDVRGKLFNSYDYGGYLIWHLWPNIPVFIDGRTPTVYDQDFFWLYNEAERKKEVWEKVAERYGINIVLVRDFRERGYASLFSWLDEDEDWRLVAFDDISNLYMKKGTGFDELIELYGFHHLQPSDITMEYAKERRGDGKYLTELEKDLQAACKRFPQDFYPFYYRGVYHQIYGTKEHFLEAEKALRRAVSNRPNFPRGYYELGFTLMKLERYDEAVAMLRKYIRFSVEAHYDAYYYIGFSLIKMGDLDEAIKFLEKHKEKAGFETRAEAYSLLGKAYIQRNKFRKAISCFERVGYLEKPTWDTLLNMGVAYFGLDELEKARECFERARKENPGALKVVYNLAVVYEKLGLQERAKRLYEEASQNRPQTPEEEALIQKAREKIRQQSFIN